MSVEEVGGMMAVVFARRRGENYVSLCPYPHEAGLPTGEQLVISPSRQIFHCFSCGFGGVPLDRAYLVQIHISLTPPDKIMVELPSFEQAKEYSDKLTMKVLMMAKQNLPNVLPPNILPFWEMGEVVEMSPAEWRVQFPEKASIARERINLSKDVVEKHISEACGRPVKLVLA